MVRQKLFVLSLLGALLSFSLLGCTANPGAEFGDDFVYDQIPSGVDAQITQGYESLASGANSSARLAFNVVINDNPSDVQESLAYVGVGYVDTRNLGSSEGIAEFALAYDLDKTNPDARVGYAGALITRGRTDDITQAIQLIEGLNTGNPNFVYADRFHLGITNAEVHALLAYAYKAAGRNTESALQAGIANQLDASVNNTTVDQILEVLAFIP
jgi:Flp pilus assembly protein TadD